MSVSSDMLDWQNNQRPNFFEKAALRTLSLLEILYIIVEGKNYRRDIKKAEKMPVPVVSVGNITAGGTGKTPCIMSIASLLLREGRHPAILSRGYKSGLEKKGGIVSDGRKILVSQKAGGDEPYMMAIRLPKVPVLVGKNRNASARKAIELGADILLLDDGFQYWKMVKDRDFVLIDATNPFGGGHVIPRGLLREPVSGLKRASLIIMTKSDQASLKNKKAIVEVIRKMNPKAPIIASKHAPQAIVPFGLWRKGIHKGLMSTMKGKKAFLVSGIGNPAAFAGTAADAGLLPIDAVSFNDHHVYTEADIEGVEQKALRMKADLILTTEKDAVKLLALRKMANLKIPLYVLEIHMIFTEKGYGLLEDQLHFETPAEEEKE